MQIVQKDENNVKKDKEQNRYQWTMRVILQIIYYYNTPQKSKKKGPTKLRKI